MAYRSALWKSNPFELVEPARPPFVELQYGILVFCTFILWNLTVVEIDFRQITDVGLVSVLTPANYFAIALLTVSYVHALHKGVVSTKVKLAHVIVLIYMLYGLPTLIEEMPRFGPAWKHVGVADYIIRHGSLDPTIDAYFNWPGFFSLSAFITQLTGVESPGVFLVWASVYFNLLYLGPLYLIFSALSQDQRVIWLSIWLFYITNWIAQDYFAPQAFAFLLLLVIWGILLQWFQRGATAASLPPLAGAPHIFWRRPISALREWIQPEPVSSLPSTPMQRVLLALIVILCFGALVMSHQLTPFAVLGGVTLLVLFNRCSLRGLPFVMAIIIVIWLNFMADTYVAGHIEKLVGHIGRLDSTVSDNLIDRLQGSDGHRFVVNMRIAMTLVVWALAFGGGLRRLIAGRRDLHIVVGAATPFALMALQTYGGELILRIYLYSLPFMVFLVAGLFYHQATAGKSWHTPIWVSLLCFGLLGGFVITRFGNERMDYITQDEMRALEYTYAIAQPDALLATSSTNLPIKFYNYEQYYYATVSNEVVDGDLAAILQRMHHKKYSQSYLILTRSQQAFLELFYGYSPAAWQRFIDELKASADLQIVYENPDAVIFQAVSNP